MHFMLMETICMKCQILFSERDKEKKKKNIINLLSAEFAQREIMVNILFTLNMRTSYLLTIFVLKFEPVNFTTF